MVKFPIPFSILLLVGQKKSNNGEDHGGEDKIAEKQGGGCQENDEIQTLGLNFGCKQWLRIHLGWRIEWWSGQTCVIAENSIFQAKAESAILQTEIIPTTEAVGKIAYPSRLAEGNVIVSSSLCTMKQVFVSAPVKLYKKKQHLGAEEQILSQLLREGLKASYHIVA
uniref:Uncharacterized protein n=1 Tax=Solanum lycopersicum TaxID=4081 RepID=A0A3Q7FL85_SOLLC